MSWYSKVVWTEGLFLRPHHFQQNDRYFEHLVESRVQFVTPYPWGFHEIEVDRDLAQQNKFGLRRASGVLPDGTPFDLPDDSPLPAPIAVPESAAGQPVWLLMPMASPNSREVDVAEADGASRFAVGSETFVDSTSQLRIEEEIEIAHPRLSLEIRKTAKPGFVGMLVARILEVSDKAIVLDERFAPPLIRMNAYPVTAGWLDKVIGWIETKLEELARYASDPSAGGGLQSVDYFMLQALNRIIPSLKHLRRCKYVHPERVYVELLKLAGELATFATRERRTREYPQYDHDNLEESFAPLLDDIQRYLNVDVSRAIRLPIVERAHNAFVATVRDRSLFRNATFVLEVSARRPLTDIQAQFPALFKIGPTTKMNDIVHAHLPGIQLVHMPTPPWQIRTISTHVYFYLDRTSPLWPEFSTASGIGMHFSGDWPELHLELWAIREAAQ
jgi:type VI secretion system protein ImpJ